MNEEIINGMEKRLKSLKDSFQSKKEDLIRSVNEVDMKVIASKSNNLLYLEAIIEELELNIEDLKSNEYDAFKRRFVGTALHN